VRLADGEGEAVSSYINHRHMVPLAKGGCCEYESHSWEDFTAARLEWLYGEGREKTPQARADLAAWNALGQRVAA